MSATEMTLGRRHDKIHSPWALAPEKAYGKQFPVPSILVRDRRMRAANVCEQWSLAACFSLPPMPQHRLPKGETRQICPCKSPLCMQVLCRRAPYFIAVFIVVIYSVLSGGYWKPSETCSSSSNVSQLSGDLGSHVLQGQRRAGHRIVHNTFAAVLPPL